MAQILVGLNLVHRKVFDVFEKPKAATTNKKTGVALCPVPRNGPAVV